MQYNETRTTRTNPDRHSPVGVTNDEKIVLLLDDIRVELERLNENLDRIDGSEVSP